jgi:hypoxanthine phosphoribosyltransferase
MKRIKLADREFELSISYAVIERAIWEIAKRMDNDLKDKDPLMICILNGSFMFAADLMKKLTIPCQISFVKVASYEGDHSSGLVRQLIGIDEDIKGRNVVLLEDIIDTGVTISHIIQQVKKLQPAEIKVATLLYKPEACRTKLDIDYVGLRIPNDFIVGFGLDYNGYGRNLQDIYTAIDKNQYC